MKRKNLALYKKIQKFFESGKTFLEKTSTVGECLIISNITQRSLFSIINLQFEIDIEYKKAENEYEVFSAEKKAVVHKMFNNKGVKATQNMIESTVKKIYKDEYLSLKENFDELQILSETCKSIKMAIFQRKDIIAETISFFKSKLSSDSCLIKNKEFLQKVLNSN